MKFILLLVELFSILELVDIVLILILTFIVIALIFLFWKVNIALDIYIKQHKQKRLDKK